MGLSCAVLSHDPRGQPRHLCVLSLMAAFGLGLVPDTQLSAGVLTSPPVWRCGERPSRTLRAVKNGGLRPSLTSARRNASGWAGRDGGMVLQSNKGMDA